MTIEPHAKHIPKDDRKIAMEREALERSFKQFEFKAGKRTWKREDLHVRAMRRFAE